MIIQFPNSPGVDVEITRGGNDPITGEPMSDQMVWLKWTEADGTKAERCFLGPQ